MNKIKKCKSLMCLTEEEHNRYFTKFYDWKINGWSEKRFHKDAKRRYQVSLLMFCFDIIIHLALSGILYKLSYFICPSKLTHQKIVNEQSKYFDSLSYY